MKHSKRLRKTMTVFLLGFMVFSLSGCGKVAEVPVNPLRNVKVAQTILTSLGSDTDYAGKLKPAKEVIVSAKISGRVEKVNFNIGDEVKQGDVLFTLDKAEAEAQYEQAQAAYQSAQANLVKTSDSLQIQQELQAEQAVEQAQLQYDDAKAYYDKMLQLYNAGSIAKQDLDNSESALTSARIQLDTAQKNLELLQTKSGPESVEVASTQVKQAEAAMNLSSLQLENTVVTSPISGVVSTRNLDSGEVISSGMPAFTVIETENLIAEVSIPENMGQTIRAGMRVPLKVKALGDKEFEGTIDSISPNADAKTHSYVVRINVVNSNQELKPDMFVKATLPTEMKNNVLTVPNEAIMIENELSYVYVVNEDKTVTRVLVKTGISDEKMTEIIDGLKEGSSIIIEGQSFVGDGDKVNIVK